VFLLKTALPAMAVLLALQGIAELLRNLLVLRGLRPPGAPPRHDAAGPL
jgi:TRAP-type mannitol/chloroaromatic compound transport system permease small subunit